MASSATSIARSRKAAPETTRRTNNTKSKIRSRVEHVFAEQKDRMGLFIRTIGIARATTKIGMANLVYTSATPLDPQRFSANETSE
jgi:hypothetical protein